MSVTDENAEDAGERLAADTFSKILDSAKLLDRTVVKRDQDERLFRTRAFFVNLSEKRLRSALIPEQWLRIIKDGKDVGYTYVVEESAAGIPKLGAKNLVKQGDVLRPNVQEGNGILIGVRSHILSSELPTAGTQASRWETTTCGLQRRRT